MDRLTKRLQEDAERFSGDVSSELDERISASLRAITPIRPAQQRPSRRHWFGWLLGGATAAAAVLAVVQLRSTPISEPVSIATSDPAGTFVVPVVDLDAQSSELISPLSQELENLQADLRKAENALRADIGF